MKHTSKICAAFLLAFTLATPNLAHANCYADYKAKAGSDDLRLHYGVIKISNGDCADVGNAEKIIKSRISRDGWQLLRVMSSFGDDGLNNRRANAGKYFLRY